MSLFETETINIFGFWSGLLILKLIAVTFLTVSYRLRKKVLIFVPFQSRLSSK